LRRKTPVCRAVSDESLQRVTGRTTRAGTNARLAALIRPRPPKKVRPRNTVANPIPVGHDVEVVVRRSGEVAGNGDGADDRTAATAGSVTVERDINPPGPPQIYAGADAEVRVTDRRFDR